ncbi:MAG: hypothetical protein EXR67_04840 [Dehalococcoidia bacterium]|nr:hypothetical protein [Dehalococcoidia bacterium]
MISLSDSDQVRLSQLKTIFDDMLEKCDDIAFKTHAEPMKLRYDIHRLHDAVSEPNPKTMAVAAILARSLLERELVPEEHRATVKVFLVRQPFDFENSRQ